MKADLKYLSSIKRSAGPLVLCLLIVYNLLFSFGLAAQTITKAEYFFDADPGNGNGTPIVFTPGGNVTFTTSIPTSSLTQGFHQLGIRVKETGGVWSIFESRGFYITAATSNASNIAGAEYFFDADPGVGNGTNVPVSSGANVNFVVSIPTASLAAGFHFLAIRTKDASGRWGVFEARGFYITASTANAPNISAAEYFFDSDPGNGNATPLAIPAGATSNFTVSLPANGLQPGFHFLGIRVKGSNGKWGVFESRGFYVTGSTTDVPNITQAEYFFDADPGNGNGTFLSVPSGATSTFTATIPVTGLTPGFHFLTIRAKRADGKWGIFESRGFYVSPILAATGDIVAAEYYIDTDPGEDNGIAATVNPSGPSINQIFLLPINGVTSGAHKIGFRVKDSNGIWSTPETKDFTVLACTPPAAPSAASGNRCNSGTVTLNATSGAIGAQVYRWYANATSTTVLFTGAAFTTPSIGTTTDFFVSVFDPATLCESNRIAVTASVISTAPPSINITNATICQGSSIKLSAPIGFTTYLWSNGEATREILVATSGNFSVVVGNGSCVSQPSVPATIIVSPKPTKPVVTTSGSTSLCDGASISLSAPAGFSYLWSDGRTTQNISVTVAGNYSVAVSDGSNCLSDPSNPINVATFTTPAKPTIDVFGSTNLCGTNTVGLLAPSGFSVYQWSSGQNTQGLTVANAGSFSVRVGNAANCLSTVSNAVTVVATGQPCAIGGGPAIDPNNKPPVIAAARVATSIGGKISLPLMGLISDPDNSVNLATLRIVHPPPSGAIAAISALQELEINYTGIDFSGQETLTIQVCDISASCSQQQIIIDVTGEIKVYNAISPNGDGLNDSLFIEYISIIDEAKNNTVRIFNRWGDVVYEAENYNNTTIAFRGLSTSGDPIPSGTYFYRIDFRSGIPVKTGFFSLRR